jgi:hypothetical protein
LLSIHARSEGDTTTVAKHSCKHCHDPRACVDVGNGQRDGARRARSVAAPHHTTRAARRDAVDQVLTPSPTRTERHRNAVRWCSISPTKLRRHPMNGAAAGWASRPAAGPHKLTHERRVVAVQGPQQAQETTPNGIINPVPTSPTYTNSPPGSCAASKREPNTFALPVLGDQPVPDRGDPIPTLETTCSSDGRACRESLAIPSFPERDRSEPTFVRSTGVAAARLGRLSRAR